MKRRDLVARLIEAEEKTVQRSLLTENSRLADIRLAYLLKDTFYDLWTTQPKKVRNAASALSILAKQKKDLEIGALARWVSGIADLTKGKTEHAIVNLDKAADFFSLENKEMAAAQTRVSKLYALALLGRYDEAISCGKAVLKIFEKYDDDLAAGKIEHNLGNILMRQERYAQAQNYLASARARFLKINNQPQVTMAENALAIIYALQNDFRVAEKFYHQALERAQKLNMLVTQAEIEASMGNLALFRGTFRSALELLERSREKYISLQMPHQQVIAELEIADAYLELNLVAEAVEIYQSIAPNFAALKMKAEEARARLQFARALVLTGDRAKALTQLKKAATLFSGEQNEVGVGAVTLLEAQISLDNKGWRDAAGAAGKAGRIFSKNGNVRHGLNALWVQGEALRHLGRPAAEELLNKTFKESLRYENPVIAQLCQISLGKLKLQKNALRDAEQHFKKALRLIEDLRAPLPAEEFRMAFLADKLAPYHELARICLADEKRIFEAFIYIEEARSRSLAESAEDDPAIKPPRLNKLSEELDRLREELNWFYSRLNRARPDEIPGLQQQARQREKKIAETMRRIASAGGKKFQEKQKFDIKKLQRQLGNSRALVEYFGLDGKISAFVLTDNTLTVFRDLCDESEIPALLEQLHFQFGALRYGAKNLGNFMADLANKTNSYLQKLYEKLLAPLKECLDGRNLVIVPYRELHYIPFHGLHNGVEYLIESRTVSYAPSAAVLQKCLLKKQAEPEDVLLMGFADEKIPLVDQEIDTLAKIFKAYKNLGGRHLRRKYLKGKRATFAAFRESAGQADILHLACHGEFRPDNPMFSSLRLADGWVTVRDVCAMRLKSGLVTLSACATGLNSVFGGDELLGLSRGFFSAGAASLLLTLWTVNDEAATELMGSFYRNLQRGMALAEALREAQLGFIRDGSHPYFWSPFVLTGRW
jgi:CHAT domain-containing protein/predicted metal-dependent hydrolase